MPRNNSEVEWELADVDLRIAGLEDYIKRHPARKLIYLVKKGGKRKGEVLDITVKQYKELTGKSFVPRTSLTPDKKHVYWYDALDSVVSEYGYKTTDELGQAIEQLHKSMREVEDLKKQRNYLIIELGEEKMPKVKAKPEVKRKAKVIAKPKRKPALAYDKKRISVDGKVTAYEITRGKEKVGYLVAFPPTYGIYPNAKGLNIRQAPLAGAKSVKKAREKAKEVL